jgi:hypothetical protein
MSALAELRKHLRGQVQLGADSFSAGEVTPLLDGLDARDEALRAMIRDGPFCFCEPEHQFECSVCKAKRIVESA